MDSDVSLTLDVPTALADRGLELLPYPTLILDDGLQVRFANETARQRFEPPPAAEDPMPPLEIVLGRSGRIPSEARAKIVSCCSSLVREGASGRHDAMIRVAPGHTIALHARGLAPDRWMVVLEDRYGRTDPNAILEDAHRDPLTELGNRRHIEQKLIEALAEDDPDNHPAVLVFDVDRFGDINDRRGWQGGDALLRAIAGRLRRATREADQIARLEGNCFAVLQFNGLGADNLAVRLVDLLGRPYLVRSEVETIGISVGIARAPEDGGSPASLLRNADLARLEAKDAGGHTWRRFGQTMAERARSRLELEADLRKAHVTKQITVAFQPKVNLRNQRITGFEALARWSHPGRGAVPPGLFIPVAEDIGLIWPIGERVLRAACAAASAWPDPLTVAVNISGRQLDEGPKFVSMVMDALRGAGLPARRLELEVTEAALLRRPEEAQAVLRELHDLGVRMTMDNFGSGFSSLRRLRTFPFDTIAIDQGLIRSLDSSGESGAIVRSLATLGVGLGMSVIAAGVETRNQARMVMSDGCTDIQGFLISRPVPAEDVGSVLALDIRDMLSEG